MKISLSLCRLLAFCATAFAASVRAMAAMPATEPATGPASSPAQVLASPTTGGSRNIALGCVYWFNIPPDYKNCTTGTEATKLTDGVYTKGHFWTQPTTVGWSPKTPVIITLDLGEAKVISGVSFSTAAGSGEARWPVSIDLLISEDGRRFSYQGDLIDLDSARRRTPLPDDRKYSVHSFETNSLNVRGRYIAFAVTAFNYVFADEIEIKGAAQTAPAPAEPFYLGPERFLALTAVQRGVARRIFRDSMAVRAMPPTQSADSSDAIQPMPVRDLLLEEISPQFRAVFPLDAAHRDVYRRAAAKLRATGWIAPFLQAVNPTEPMPHLGFPPKASAGVNVALMQNEYRAGSVAITNPLDQDRQFTLQFAGLPGGATPAYISVAEVQYTDTREGEAVASSLTDAARGDDGWTINVPSGMTRQVWFTFHPVDLQPGEYSGKVIIRERNHESSVPVSLRVAPLKFPNRPTLGLGGWDYTHAYSGGVTRGNRRQLGSVLREHFLDCPWATNTVFPPGSFDPVVGTMTAPPDTAIFDSWIRSWPDARRYGIFLNGQDSFAGFSIDSPQFTVAVRTWIQYWAKRAQQLGIRPSDMSLLLCDEPSKPEEDQRTILWARAIRSAGTGFRIWIDPIHEDISLADPELFSLADIVCANRQSLMHNKAYASFFASERAKALRLEMYSAYGPARSMDPYAYYRLQAWDCWNRGIRVQHFWSFCDNGGASSWNEYTAPRTAYTPLFLDSASVTGSKQMEAIREGIEDYEYLVMLKSKVSERLERDPNDPLALEARKLLERAAPQVLAGEDLSTMFNRSRRDRTTADSVRLQVLDAILSLQ